MVKEDGKQVWKKSNTPRGKDYLARFFLHKTCSVQQEERMI